MDDADREELIGDWSISDTGEGLSAGQKLRLGVAIVVVIGLFAAQTAVAPSVVSYDNPSVVEMDYTDRTNIQLGEYEKSTAVISFTLSDSVDAHSWALVDEHGVVRSGGRIYSQKGAVPYSDSWGTSDFTLVLLDADDTTIEEVSYSVESTAEHRLGVDIFNIV
jgi:hypothetical protein